MFFWLILFIVMQPLYTFIDYFLDLHVRSTAAYITEKAGSEGMVTPELYVEAINMLTAVGFRQDDISIQYNNTLHERGERIEVVIQIPRQRIFIYNFGTSSPSYYYAKNTVMSEYLN